MKHTLRQRLTVLVLPLVLPMLAFAEAKVGETLDVPMGATGGYFRYEVCEDAVGLYATLRSTQDTGALTGTLGIPATVTIGGSELPVRGIRANLTSILKCTRLEIPSSALDHCENLLDDGAYSGEPKYDCPLTDFVVYATSAGNKRLTHAPLVGLWHLKTVSIAGVKFVETNAVYCSSFQTLTFDEGLESIDAQLIHDFRTTVCSAYAVNLPSTVTNIGSHAFNDCPKMASLTIASPFFTLGESAFYGCHGLSSFAVPAGTRRIPDWAFAYCGNCLITLPDSVTEIGNHAFGPKARTSGTGSHVAAFPPNVTWVGTNAFERATIDTVAIPSGWTTVPADWFNQARIGTLTIPDSVTSIGTNAFLLDSCETLTVGAGLASVSKDVFKNVKNLTVNGSGATVLPDEAFRGEPLASLSLSGVASIGAYAFANCAALKYAEIPATVTAIGADAFAGTGISILMMKGTPPAGLAAAGLPAGCRVMYPESLADAWSEVTIPNVTVMRHRPDGEIAPPDTTQDWAARTDIYAHKGILAADETWEADKVHVVYGWVTVPYGKTLTIANGAVVKFCPGMGIFLEGGACSVPLVGNAVYFTSIHDDQSIVGGDTDGDGGATEPTWGTYEIWGEIANGGKISYRCFEDPEDYMLVDRATYSGNVKYTICQNETDGYYLKFSGLSDSLNNASLDIPAKVDVEGKGLLFPVLSFSDFSGSTLSGSGNLRVPSAIFRHCGSHRLGGDMSGALIVYKSDDRTYAIPPECFLGQKFCTASLAGISRLEGDKSHQGPFNSCSTLTSINLGADLEFIGYRTFAYCTALTAISLPPSVKVLEERAFENCPAVTSLDLGHVESIGEAAIGCKLLTEVTIPDSVTNLANYAFDGSTGLKTVTIGSGLPIVSLSPFPWNIEHLIVNGSGETLFGGHSRNSWGPFQLQDVTLHGVKALTNSFNSYMCAPFNNCPSLTSITADSALKEIGEYGLYGISALEVFVVPDSVTCIGKSAFGSCSKLKQLTFGAGVTSIGESAFSSCTALETIALPDSVTEIGRDAFTGCSGCKTFRVGSGYKRIQSERLPKTAEYALEVRGDGTTVIENGAFYWTSIKSADLSGVKYLGNEGDTGSVTGPFHACTKLETVTLGEGLIQIGGNCFAGCKTLRSLVLPSSVKVIGQQAFNGCTSLESIGLAHVESIGNGAFSSCAALENLTIPQSVTNVGESVFYNCSALTNLVIVNKGGVIGSDWHASSAAGGTVTIQGDGETVIGPKAFAQSEIGKVVLDGVSSIQDSGLSSSGAFASSKIESCELGEGLGYIGYNAFLYQQYLTEITIPDSVTNIGSSAFSSCTALSRVRLGTGLRNISASAFQSDKQITYIEIPESVTNIASTAFSGIPALTMFFDGAPVSNLNQITESYNNITIIRPAAYSNEWAQIALPANVTLVPEPEEGVTWIADASRDWANTAQVYAHKGTIATNETWAADKTHVVYGWITIPNGVTVTVEPGAVVKFCTGMGAVIKQKGNFILEGATVTHVHDDLVGGDSDGDFGTRTPVAGAYTIYGYPQDSDATTYRARVFHYAGELPQSTTWPGDYNVHYLDGDFTIPAGKTLTLAKGAIVKVADRSGIVVNGGLYAQGNRGEKVYITSCHDDEVGGDSDGDGGERNPMWADWHNISVNQGGEVALEHAVVRYCCSNVGDTWLKPGMSAIAVGGGASATLKNCTVSECFRSAVYSAGDFSAENCIFSGIRESAVSYASDGQADILNCVFYDCKAISSRLESSAKRNYRYRNCIFCNVQAWLYSDGSLTAPCETSDAVTFDHCCFYYRRDGSETCDLAGTGGNINEDPLFVNSAEGDFRIDDLSPCVDAGSAVGPDYDYYGQPRQNAAVDPTGEADAKGRYRDIGIYEVIPLEGALDAPDLQVTDVVVDKEAFNVGDALKVRYRVSNVSENNDASGSRRDHIELVGDSGVAYDLGLVTQGTSLPCGGGVAQSCEASVIVPPMPVGDVKLRVTVNSECDLFEGVSTANNRAESGTLALSVGDRTLDIGEKMTFTLTPLSTVGYRLVGDIPADTLLYVKAGTRWSLVADGGRYEIPSSETTKLVVRSCAEAMPSEVRYDREAEQVADGQYLLSLVEGSQYVTFENTSDEVIEVTVERAEAGFCLLDMGIEVYVNTNHISGITQVRKSFTGWANRLGWQSLVDSRFTNSPVIACLRYYGNCFKEGMTAALVSDDCRIEAQIQRVCNRNAGYAQFDLFGQKPGLYRLEVAQDGVTHSKNRIYLYDPYTYLYETDYEVYWGAIGVSKSSVENDMFAVYQNPRGTQVRISTLPKHIKTGMTYRPTASWQTLLQNGEVEVPWLRLSSLKSQIRLSNSDPWSRQIDLILLSRREPRDILAAGDCGSFPFEFRALREVKLGEKPDDPYEGVSCVKQWSSRSSGTDYLSEWREQLKTWRDHGVQIQSVIEPEGTVQVYQGDFAVNWYHTSWGQLVVEIEPKYVPYVFKSLENEPYPWEANAAHLRPMDASDALWGIILPQMRTLYGETWGSWKKRLVNRACRFADCCRERPWMVLKSDIVQADVRRICGDDPLVPTLAVGRDALVPGRGVPLAVTRRYYTGLSSRFATGLFGRGWHCRLDARLYRKNSSQLSIGEPGRPKDVFYYESESLCWRHAGGTSRLENNRQTYLDGSYREFDNDGYLLKMMDVRNRGVTVEYDDAHHIARLVHTDGASLRFVYEGDVVSQIYAKFAADGAERLQARYVYANRGGEKVLTEAFGYDGSHQIYDYAESDASPGSLALARSEVPGLAGCDYVWDENGRLATITVGNAFVTEFQHEETLERMIDPKGGVTVAEIGPAGQILSLTDPENQTLKFDYDPSGRMMIGAELPSGRRYKFTYSASRQLLETVTPSDATLRYEYAKCGKLAKLIDAEAKMRKCNYNKYGELDSTASSEGFGYRNAYSEVTGDCESTIYYGNTARYDATYDAHGLRTGLTSIEGDRPIAYAYTETGGLTNVVDAVGGNIAIACDATNRITRFTAMGRAYNLTYDGYRGISSLIDDEGAGERYVYDDLGRLVRVVDARDAGLVHYAAEYDATSGALVKESFGTNNVTCAYEFDGRGLLARLLNKRGGTTVADLKYAHSPDGVITSIVNQTQSRRNDFGYDKDGQLIQAYYGSTNRTDNFLYDAAGTRKGLTASVRLAPGTGRALGLSDVADPSFGTYTFGYDEYGRINAVTVATDTKTIAWSCDNDALGSRVRIRYNGKTYERVTLPGTNLLLDEYEDGVHIRHHIYANGRRIATVTPDGVRYLVSDNTGSVRWVYNEKGELTGSAEFDAWGGTLSSEGTDAGLCGWCAALGVETDPTGLHWMFHRYYSSRLGRFLNEDPIGFAGGDFNFRRYCLNDPVNACDSLGLLRASALNLSSSIGGALFSGAGMVLSFIPGCDKLGAAISVTGLGMSAYSIYSAGNDSTVVDALNLGVAIAGAKAGYLGILAEAAGAEEAATTAFSVAGKVTAVGGFVLSCIDLAFKSYEFFGDVFSDCP